MPRPKPEPDAALVRVTEETRRLYGLGLALAIAAMKDPGTPRDDVAAYVAVLGRLHLEIGRALTPARKRLAEEMRTDGILRLGTLRFREKPAEVEWVCNDPANFDDATVQDALADLFDDPYRRKYVRRVPAHLELDYLAIVADMRAGSEAARRLFEEADRAGWRRKGPAKATIEADEVKL